MPKNLLSKIGSIGEKISEKQESAENSLKKRKDFYTDIHNISFNVKKFDKSDLESFANDVSGQAADLASLCNDKAGNSKGKKTIACLNAISTDATKLQESILEVAKEKGINHDYFNATRDAFENLSGVLLKVKKTIFPSIISQAVLDYNPTKKYMQEMSKNLLPCFNTFLTLCFEYDCNILLDECDTKTANKNGEIKLNNQLYFYCPTGSPYRYFFFRPKVVNSYNLNRLIEFTDKLSDFKDLDDLKERLETLLEKINDEDERDEDSKGQMCDSCEETYTGEKEIHKVGPCKHMLCIDCLQKMVGKRFNKYKCPVKGCKKTLNKKEVDYYIAHAEE